MNSEGEQYFFLGERGKAHFDMFPLNVGWNGIGVSLTTHQWDDFQEAVFQFDDGVVAEGNNGQSSAIMLEVLQGKMKKKVPSLLEIPETEIIWARDSRCNYPGPALGFLAFQRKMAGEAINILCMGMKKERRDSPDRNNLNTPTVLFVLHGQKPISDEYPAILIPEGKQKSFEYLVGRLYQAQQKANIPTLGRALDHAAQIFLDPFEPESLGEIKRVFDIK